MKRSLLILLTMLLSATVLTGCEKKEEAAPATETYVEENEIQVVHHDTENVDFDIAVIEGEMLTGFERLMGDAEKKEAANQYRFHKYADLSKFKSLLEAGIFEIATLSLEEAVAVNEEKPEFICVLSINANTEAGYGVTVANINFAKTYPSALKVFMEEMTYSAKEATCITGEEMRTLIEEYLTEQEIELPGDEFYYPLPEITEEENVDVEELETND